MSSGSLPTFSADSHGQRPLSPNMIPMLASLIVVTVVFTSCSRSSAQIAKSGPTMVARLTPENWNDLVPRGKEVDAIYGDIVLRNELITAVIANPASTRNANMTVKSVGGCLIDLAVNDAASDQLSAFYPGRRVFRFEDGVSVGSHGKSVTLGGVTATASTSELTIQSRGGGSQPDCVVKYSIEGGKPYVKISSTWTNTSDKEIKLTLEDDLRADGGKEDMPKVPNGTHELFWFQDIHWQQAYGVSAPGYTIRCNSNARESVLSYEAVDGRDMILKPGASFEFVRHVYVAKDLPLVLAMHEEESGRGANHRNVTLVVQDHQAKPVTGARVELKVNGHSRGIAVSDQEGKIQTALPTGDGLAEVSLAGLNFASSKFRIEDTTSNVPIQLDEYMPGTAMITVTDAEGRSIPAKVEFDGSGDTQTPNWGPETAEHFVRNLAYTPDGKVQATLASGTYDLIISHGPEYDAEFTKLQVEAGKTSEVQVKLSRVVNTTGWVSADFHSHSSPSGDNTGSQLGRVLNLAAEHVEFAPCTEHNRISTYVDHIQSQNLGAFLSTVSGMELTGSPLPLNHQNAFPLIYKPRTQDGGAPTPDGSPETQVERLAAW
ncbi:MAG: hypothetical protein KDA91_22750, partial [Planctomycetaceae bacterium]|nr:hypothetical protein [Planctomycetaceae bacterium]